MTDDAFIRAILDNPRDDAPRLVYADWLDERGDPTSITKAEVLRLTAQLTQPGKGKGWKKARRKRLQQLAAALDPDWLAAVSRLAVENCYEKRVRGESRRVGLVQFEFLCDRRWEDLRPTDDRTIRFCDACRQSVHYCDTINEARRHAWEGRCIAVDIGVIRRERDLEPERMYLGRPSAETLRQERERMEQDPVSAERERRKKDKNGS
jgi:uncharacterized protein (TIGR02996 family)